MKILISHWYKVPLMVIGIVIVFSFVSIAQADCIVKQYKAMKGQDKEITRIYLTGVGVGTRWVNAELKHSGKPPLYCVPDELVLETDNYSRILDDEIKRTEKRLGFQKTQDFPIGLLLLDGLKNTFPCN